MVHEMNFPFVSVTSGFKSQRFLDTKMLSLKSCQRK